MCMATIRSSLIRWLQIISYVIIGYSALPAQTKEYIAMVPSLHDRRDVADPGIQLRLERQQFILFVYRDAVVVYTEVVLANTGPDSLMQELALPSTGHDENGDAPGGRISSGI